MGLILCIYGIQPLAARASQRPSEAGQPKRSSGRKTGYGSINGIDLSPHAWVPRSPPGPIDDSISRILNRDQIPALLEEEGATRGAEVGLNLAVYAQRVLSEWGKCQKYVLIDAWRHLDNYHDIANVGAHGFGKKYATPPPFCPAWPPAAYFRMAIVHGRPTGVGCWVALFSKSVWQPLVDGVTRIVDPVCVQFSPSWLHPPLWSQFHRGGFHAGSARSAANRGFWGARHVPYVSCLASFSVHLGVFFRPPDPFLTSVCLA